MYTLIVQQSARQIFTPWKLWGLRIVGSLQEKSALSMEKGCNNCGETPVMIISPITFRFNDKMKFYGTVGNNRVLLPIVEEQTNNKIEDLCKYRCVLQVVIFYAFKQPGITCCLAKSD